MTHSNFIFLKMLVKYIQTEHSNRGCLTHQWYMRISCNQKPQWKWPEIFLRKRLYEFCSHNGEAVLSINFHMLIWNYLFCFYVFKGTKIIIDHLAIDNRFIIYKIMRDLSVGNLTGYGTPGKPLCPVIIVVIPSF